MNSTKNQECGGRFRVECDGCGELYYSEELLAAECTSGERLRLCQNCRLDGFYCDDCGRYAVDESDLNWRSGYLLCNDCCGDGDCDCIEPYGHTNARRFYRQQDDALASSGLFAGLELEFEGLQRNEFARDAKRVFGDAVDCKRDCSLRAGVELAFQPMSPAFLLTASGVFEYVEQLARKHDMHASSTCGMHVHLSRTFCDCSTITSMATLLWLHANEWAVFSGRDLEDLNRWARITSPYDEKTWRSRYVALNQLPYKTVELRLWAGRDQARDMASMAECSIGLALVANTYPLDALRDLDWRALVRVIAAELDGYGLPHAEFAERANTNRTAVA